MTPVEFVEARIAEDEARRFHPSIETREDRECEAYRAILALGQSLHVAELRTMSDGHPSVILGDGEPVWRALARIWRDHPDYDSDWGDS